MILSTAKLQPEQRFYLFDTFSGIPGSRITAHEAAQGFAGKLANTSANYVSDYLKAWREQIVIVEGDVFDTVPKIEVGQIAFCHMDLNLSAPTKLAIDYAYPRLIRGGMVVFDDYGFEGYEDQRMMLDAFFSDKPEQLIALPTGQALVIKL